MNQITKKQLIGKPLFIIFGLATLVGLICWFLQLTQGLQLTNLNNHSVWGLYIVGFVLFTGVAAGSLLFASSAYLFKLMEEFKPYARIVSFVGAISSVVAAGLFIMVDIGNPGRAWYFITSANISSPMFWDSIILLVYLVVGLWFTQQLIKAHEGQAGTKSIRTLSIIAFVAGLFVMVTSFVFAFQVARPFWNNPAQPVSFLAAAIAAALALYILLFVALNKGGYIQISEARLSRMAKVAAICLIFELVVVLAEITIGLYAGTGGNAAIINWLISGDGIIFFWLQVVLLVGGVVLLSGKNVKTLVIGAVAALFGVFMVKYNLLQAQLVNPLITYAGPPGYSGVGGAYLPSIIELGVAVGIIAIAGLVVMVGLNSLNLGARS